jgi:hypothetical protein
MLAWLKCLVSQVKWLYRLFIAFRKNNLYLLAHNGQVCLMEATLNDVFDPVLRGIYITDGSFKDPLFLFLDAEVKPLWVGLDSEAGVTSYPDPQVLFTSLETYTLGVCFIVNIPLLVSLSTGYDEVRLRALVDLYRLTSRSNYSVEIF